MEFYLNEKTVFGGKGNVEFYGKWLGNYVESRYITN